MRAGTAALELLALCALVLVVGMFSPRATPTSAGVLAGLGLVGIVAAAGLLPASGAASPSARARCCGACRCRSPASAASASR